MARGLLRRVEARGAGAALVAWGWVAKAQGRQRRVGRRVVARLQVGPCSQTHGVFGKSRLLGCLNNNSLAPADPC